MSYVEDGVIQMIKDREAVGRKKYGVGLERTDYDIPTWDKHHLEELLDAALYTYKKMLENQKREEEFQQMKEALNRTMEAFQELNSDINRLKSNYDLPVNEHGLDFNIPYTYWPSWANHAIMTSAGEVVFCEREPVYFEEKGWRLTAGGLTASWGVITPPIDPEQCIWTDEVKTEQLNQFQDELLAKMYAAISSLKS